MKRLPAFLVLILVLVFVSSALAQSVTCVPGGFSLTLPDHFSPIQDARQDDDLCFAWHSKALTIYGYATDMGRKLRAEDLFQVLNGTETDYGTLTINGQDMLYARGKDDQGAYALYSWMNGSTNVSLYFYYNAKNKNALLDIDDIIHSLSLI